jgi:hypothetical protein
MLAHLDDAGGIGARGEADDVMKLAFDLVGDLVASVVDEIRERPGVAAAIVAGVCGALIGIGLAGLVGRRPKRRAASAAGGVVDLLAGLTRAVDLEGRTQRVAHMASQAPGRGRRGGEGLLDRMGHVRNATDLLPIGLSLLENPLVRTFVRGMVVSRLRKRFR